MASSQLAVTFFDGSLLAIDASQLENFATFGSLVPILIGLVIFKLVASALIRTFVLTISLALGALIFLQRNEISDCVADARENLEEDRTSVSCTILGFDIDIDI
ncbi:MAG: hypothetical protein RL119_1273 [Actinomycetota bacterium]|jgi:hypothetical protein